MKAKEYADQYYKNLEEKDDKYALGKAVIGMFAEMGSIMKSRNIKKNSSMAPVILEVNQKWNAFARITGAAAIDGFLKFVIDKIPEVETVINLYLKGVKK